jgi:hypothetical protein
LTNAFSLWGYAANTYINKLQTFQNEVLRIITELPRVTPIATSHEQTGMSLIRSHFMRLARALCTTSENSRIQELGHYDPSGDKPEYWKHFKTSSTSASVYAEQGDGQKNMICNLQSCYWLSNKPYTTCDPPTGTDILILQCLNNHKYKYMYVCMHVFAHRLARVFSTQMLHTTLVLIQSMHIKKSVKTNMQTYIYTTFPSITQQFTFTYNR